jgi:hypothetical protein
MTITTYIRQRAFHTSFDVGPLRSSADSIMNKLADACFFYMYFPIACCYRFLLSPAISRVPYMSSARARAHASAIFRWMVWARTLTITNIEVTSTFMENWSLLATMKFGITLHYDSPSSRESHQRAYFNT